MAKLLLITVLFTSLAAIAYQSSAKIYVWRNEQGILVFSDTPRPGAEQLNTPEANIIKSSISLNAEVLDIHPQPNKESYQIEIDMPKNDATIRDNTGSVHIHCSVKPQFKQAFKVQLFLDEKPYGQPKKRSIFSLRNIDRGEHNIKIELHDAKGKVIASSKQVTFYMHRATVN